MTIYEYMDQLGYTKHQQYPNGFERVHNDVRLLIIFNYRAHTAKGRIVPIHLIKNQNDIDDLQKAYYLLIDDLKKISDVGIIIDK